VSLILEALRKLEREKRSSEPGFLVLGPTTWSSGARGTRGAVLALIGGLALLATALGLLAWRNARRAAAPEDRAAAAVPPAPLHSAVRSVAAEAPPAPASAPMPIPIATPVSAAPAAAAPASRRAEVLDPAASAPEPARVDERAIRAVAEAQPPPLPEEQPRFRLQAISLRDGKPVAVLNDRLVYEGESFDGVRVVRIGEAEVELELDGRRLVVGF
jgi:hypothetical protein